MVIAVTVIFVTTWGNGAAVGISFVKHIEMVVVAWKRGSELFSSV